MMPWIFTAVAAIAAFFYGRWQQARASRAETALAQAQSALAQAAADHDDRVRRLNAAILSLKIRLKQLEDTIYAANDPDTVRTLFAQLFPPSANP